MRRSTNSSTSCRPVRPTTSSDGSLMLGRHFLDLSDAGGDAIAAMLERCAWIARQRGRTGRRGEPTPMRRLAGHVLAMVFEKNSTRTRVSFDMAMRQLGGSALILDAGTSQLGRGESVADTARVLEPDGRCDHDAHRRSRQGRGDGASRRRAGDQWSDRPLAPVPDRGRPADHHRTGQGAAGAAKWPGSATATMCCTRCSKRPG